MSFPYFAIFRQERWARVARVLIPAGKNLPSAFRYEGRIYVETKIALGNADHLLDADRELLGFSFLLAEETEVGRGRLAKECMNVRSQSGIWLNVVLNEERPYHNDACQMLYPFVYSDEDSDHIVLVGESPGCWSALGFRLATQPLPEPVFDGAFTT
jgi:hypothetical protein